MHGGRERVIPGRVYEWVVLAHVRAPESFSRFYEGEVFVISAVRRLEERLREVDIIFASLSN